MKEVRNKINKISAATRFVSILIAALFFCSGVLTAQGNPEFKTDVFNVAQKEYVQLDHWSIIQPIPEFKIENLKTNSCMVLDTRKVGYDQLGIFCKMEHILEQKSGIALRLRLGSLDYVNKLENKQ